MKKRITTLSLKKELKYLKQNFDINQTKPVDPD